MWLGLSGCRRLRPAWLQCRASEKQQKSGLEAVDCSSNPGKAIAEASTNSPGSFYARWFGHESAFVGSRNFHSRSATSGAYTNPIHNST